MDLGTTMAAAVGTKRSYVDERPDGEKSPACGVLEKRNKCNYWEDDDDDDDAAVGPAPAVGAKRGYERDEEKSDVIFEKRYKSNCWEDPAWARDLQRWGSSLAQMAALDIHHERFLQEMRAWNAARAASHSHHQ